VLKAAPETETKQENIQAWLELDERNLGFHLTREKEITAVIFFYWYFHQHNLQGRANKFRN
jgi:hypothetical protein